MYFSFHIMVMVMVITMVVILSSAAAAQQHGWNIYDSTNHGITGFVPMQLTGDTLYGHIDSNTTAIPVSSINLITIRRGNYFGVGATIGGLVGLGYGIVHIIGHEVVSTSIERIFDVDVKDYTSYELQAILYTAVGAVIGGAFGALIPNQEVFRFNGTTASVRLDIINSLIPGNQH